MPSPTPSKGQMTFTLDAPADDRSAMERVKNTFDWGYGFRTWIHWEMKPGQEMIGEEMVRHAAQWIGKPSKGYVVGPACKTMADQGYLIDTGRWQSMQNEASNNRRSPIWRRSDKR